MGTYRSSQIMPLLFFVIITLSSALALASSIISERTDEEVMALYDQWRAKHGKLRNGLRGQRDDRFEIFKDNLKYIDEINAQNLPYRLGLNVFADLTNAEYRSKYLGTRFAAGSRRNKTSSRYQPRLGDKLPDSVDWREKGAVVPVKDQGSCGNFLFSRILPISIFSSFPIFTLNFLSFPFSLFSYFLFCSFTMLYLAHTHATSVTSINYSGL